MFAVDDVQGDSGSLEDAEGGEAEQEADTQSQGDGGQRFQPPAAEVLHAVLCADGLRACPRLCSCCNGPGLRVACQQQQTAPVRVPRGMGGVGGRVMMLCECASAGSAVSLLPTF